MRSKTRVAIVTGFLGSGKTTLVREILAQSAKRKVRTAALVNDIAEINVDRELLQISDPSHPAAIDGDGNHGQSGDVLGGRKRRVELADGCVCCSIKDDLMEAAVSAIRNERPDYLVIETSGVSNPYPVIELFRKSKHLNDLCQLDAVITLVDTSTFEEAFAESASMRNQVGAADLVLLNKVDLASEHQFESVRRTIENLQHKPKHIKCVRAKVPMDAIINLTRSSDAEAYDELMLSPAQSQHHHHHHHHHGDGGGGGGVAVTTFSFRHAGSGISLHRFQLFLRALPRGLLRAKGFVTFCCMPGVTFEIHLCGRRYEAVPFSPSLAKRRRQDNTSFLSFIGIELDEASMRRDLQACICSTDPCTCDSKGDGDKQTSFPFLKTLQNHIVGDKRFDLLSSRPPWPRSLLAFTLKGTYGGSVPRLTAHLVDAANKELACRLSMNHSIYLTTGAVTDDADASDTAPGAGSATDDAHRRSFLCMQVGPCDSTSAMHMDADEVWKKVQREVFVVLSNLVDPKQQEMYTLPQ
mmetsp:Transcript_198/g.398  ORF Transcript_198/g.398 Transcript_198/m.398 type:complete len:525 (+) Transcript_198:167-1741(+)